MVRGIDKLMGVPWCSFMRLLAKPVSSCAIRLVELSAASWLPEGELELLGSELASRSTSVQAVVHSDGTHRLEQLGVTFSDTGVLCALKPWRLTALLGFAASHKDM